MRIEIVGVSAQADGAEVLLTVAITDDDGIRTQKRKLAIFTEKYVDLDLRRGALIDEDTFDMLDQLSRQCRAIKKGSELLSYSSASKSQLVRKLKMRGFEKEDAEHAADFLESAHVIDEGRDIERLVALCLKKLWGRKRIYCELVKKGYDKSEVADAIAEVSPDEFVAGCVRLIKKKVGQVPADPVEKKRLVAFLTRYGYSFSEIREAFDKC